MKKALKTALTETTSLEKENALLKSDLSKYVTDFAYQKKRADGLEALNDQLRAAMGHQVNKENPQTVLRFAPKPLKHTPHFLGGYQ